MGLQSLGGGPWGEPLSCPPSRPLPSQDQVSKDKALQSMASMSSAQIVSASIQNKFSPPSPLPQAVFSPSSRVRVRVRVREGGLVRACLRGWGEDQILRDLGFVPSLQFWNSPALLGQQPGPSQE